MRYLCLGCQLQRQRAELPDRGETMEKLVGEYGDSFIAAIFGQAVVMIFIQIFNYVTSF